MLLALIDATGGPAYFEHVRTALLGALEALPPTAHLALISFSDQVPSIPQPAAEQARAEPFAARLVYGCSAKGVSCRRCCCTT